MSKQNDELDLEKMEKSAGGEVKPKKIKGWFGRKKTVYEVTSNEDGRVIYTDKDKKMADYVDKVMNHPDSLCD